MKKIENVKVEQTWTTYAGSLYGSLKAAGMWDGDLDTMMGETGILFHFIMEDGCCPSGVTVYNWMNTHYAMADRIGIANEVFIVHKEPQWNTFEAAQEIAVDKIRASIDRGVAPVVWAPTKILEFGLVGGYDDDEKLLLPEHCLPDEPDPILYDNFGLSEVPIIHVQTFYKSCDYDRERTIRNSLRFGVDHWNSQFHMSNNYGAGKKGWENCISALHSGSFNGFGLTYCMNVYADSKRRIPGYLDKTSSVADYLQPLADAADHYREVAKSTDKMAELLPFRGPGQSEVKEHDVQILAELATAAYEQETRAMSIIEDVLEK